MYRVNYVAAQVYAYQAVEHMLIVVVTKPVLHLASAMIHAVLGNLLVDKMHCAEFQIIELFVSVLMATKVNPAKNVHHMNALLTLTVKTIRDVDQIENAGTLVLKTELVEQMLNVV